MWIARKLATPLAALLLSLGLGQGTAFADAYEAKLPDDLATAADLCTRVPCAEVFPGSPTAHREAETAKAHRG